MRYLFSIIICLLFINRAETRTSSGQGTIIVSQSFTLNSSPAQKRIVTGTSADPSLTNRRDTVLMTEGAVARLEDTTRARASRALIDTSNALRMWANNAFLSTASPAASISGTDITHWNNAYSTVYTNGWGIDKAVAGSTTTFFIDTTVVPSLSNMNTAIAGVQALIPTNNTQLSNGAGYITGINSTMINSALGYTPYNSSNPNGYSSVNGTGFVTASGTTLSYDNNTYYLASNPNGYTTNTGTLTSITATSPLTGGTIAGTGSIGLGTAGIPGTYGSATQTPVLTTDIYGRVTGVTNTTITPLFSSIAGTPTTLSGYGIADAYPLSGNPSNFLTSVPAQSFASLTSKPTTLGGYGITDAYPLSGNPSGFVTASSSTSFTNKSGNISQWTNDAGYLTNVSAGYAILVSGSTIKTISVDTNNLMTNYKADTAVAGIDTKINGKVPNTRTLTIAGVTQDLSANRTFSPTTTNIPEGTNQYFTNARAYAAMSLTTTGSGAATYNSTTGTLNVPVSSVSTPTFNVTPNRALSTTGSNNTFTISTTKNARVTYVVNIAVALTLLPPLTSNAVVSLDYSVDAGSSWISVCRATQTYGVAVTLTTSSDYVLSGEIPANALVRVYRSSTTGATISLPTTVQQEVTY